jgi:hypothetical protein
MQMQLGDSHQFGEYPQAQGNTEVSSRSVEQEQAARGAFIEWLILDYSSNSYYNP